MEWQAERQRDRHLQRDTTQKDGLKKHGIMWMTNLQLDQAGTTVGWAQAVMQKQGRIHGYPSRVRVGRGPNWGYQIILAGAAMPKKPKTQEK